MFQGIFDSAITETVAVNDFLLCIGVSLLIGFYLAFMYAFKSRHTKSFVMTLSLLPAIVCVVIMMVNGNVGAGVAVAGAFSLIRFRSVPGTARDIGTIFIAMAAGIVAGMGYLGFAVLFTLVIGTLLLVLNLISTYAKAKPSLEKTLRITIPEDLNYCDIFDEIFAKYTTSNECVMVKTTNMGSLYKLTYNITLRNTAIEKEFIDALRCRNGNLEISISKQEANVYEL